MLDNTTYYQGVKSFAGAIGNLTVEGSRPTATGAAPFGELARGRAFESLATARKSFPAKGGKNQCEATAPSLDTYGTSVDFRCKAKNPLDLFVGPHGETCGSWTALQCKGCRSMRRIYKGCEKRVTCHWCRAAYIRDTKFRFKPVLRMMRGRVRFITLTVKNGRNLNERKQHLKHAFKKLRQRKFWRSYVDGGIRTLEVTAGKGGDWHVHFHILCTGRYMPQAELSAEWQRVTGDSSIVDIRRVDNPESAAPEIFKYALKDAELTPEQLAVAEKALKGERLIATFGNLYRRELPKPECAPCECCGGVRWRFIKPTLNDVLDFRSKKAA